MAFKLKGVVIELTPTQTFSSKNGNSYTSRYLVIQTIKFDQYTGKPTIDPENTPKFTFFGKQCEVLNNIKFGDIVTVNFDIQGRAYDKDGKREYFTEVRPFRVDVENQPTITQQSAPIPTAQPVQAQSLYDPQQTFAQSPAMNSIQNAFPNAEIVNQEVMEDGLPF